MLPASFPAPVVVSLLICQYLGLGFYLNLNLGFCNILLASATTSDLLCFRDLWSDSVCAEVLQRKALHSIDAQLRVGLDDSESSRHYCSNPCQPLMVISKTINLYLSSNDKVGIGTLHTKELLASTGLLDDLNQSRLQLFDGGNGVGENTHLSGLGGDIDLHTVRLVSPFCCIGGRQSFEGVATYTSMDL